MDFLNKCDFLSCQQIISTLPEATYNSHELINALIAAIVGAFSAYIFNLLHWKKVHSIEKRKNIIFEIEKLTDGIEKLSVNYWLVDYSPDSAGELKLKEISIKSYLRIIINFCRFLNENNIPSNLDTLTSELYEFCSGGDFESIQRKKCENTATNISITCAEIRLDLSKSLYSSKS